MDNGDAAQNYLTMDGLGRVLRSEQRVGSVAYRFDYTYAANGFQKSVTYPSTKRVDYTQSLRGLPLSAVVGTNAYASGVVYNAAGAMREMVGGSNAFKQTWGYNAKGQMLDMEANAGATLSTLRLRLDLGYGADDANTGNLMDQKITAGADVYPQYFRYDAANRLALFVENPSPSTPPVNHTDPCVTYGASTRCQRYGFDRFGNIWQAERQGPGVDMLTSGATSYNGSTSRIAVAQYDAAGNMEQYGAGITTQMAVYDSEGRISQITGAGTPIDYYYDGEGLRIKKKVGAVTTVFVYDAAKQLMAEYEVGGGPVSGGVNYLVTDHLGSTRMLLDGSGGVVERFDYVPFGGELVRSGNGYGVAGDPVKQKFGGKERDGESGLDYFGARYMSAAQGRFTSPDPSFLNILKVTNPQRWNRFAFGLSNPLGYIDPDGQEAIAIRYPGYQVQSRNSLPGIPLGHAGVVVVMKDGSTHYFEYGRYEGPDGQIRNAGPGATQTPRLDRDATGDFTKESMAKLLKTLSRAAGKGGRVDALVIQTTELQDSVMLAYLINRQNQNEDPNRKKYSLLYGYNCGTLVCETLNSAGKHAVPQKFRNSATPYTIFDYLWSIYQNSQAASYDPKTDVTSIITYRE